MAGDEPPPLEALLEACLSELLRPPIQHHMGALLDQFLRLLKAFHYDPCQMPVLYFSLLR